MVMNKKRMRGLFKHQAEQAISFLRHWPLFGQFARRALRRSRYPLQLPPGASVFDLFPLLEDGTLQPFDGRYLSCRVKNIPATFCVLPQYERVVYVLDLLLGHHQPALLVGEPGGGKTSFAETLVQPNHLCQRVCVSFALKAADLRQLLQRKSHEKGPLPLSRAARAAALKGLGLFLVEDLHMARLDPDRGTSPVVESLRQALTHQQFYHTDTLELQHFPAGGFNCFGTLSVPVLGAAPLCPRFGRLFTAVVLPPLTREALLSMHMPAVLAWLEKFPLLTRHGDLAAALVRASVEAYEAVKGQFPPSPACCLFHFSLHSLRQVFQGLYLLRPGTGIHLSCPLEEHGVKSMFHRRSSAGARMAGAGYTVALSVRQITRLWLHEALRTFGDPLRGENHRAACGQLLLEVAMANFCSKRTLLHVVPSLGPQSSHHPSRSHISFPQTSLSRSCALAPAEEEEEEEEEDFLPVPESLQDSPGCSKADQPDPWDPVLQAPALALEPPDSAGDPTLEELEQEGPEAEPQEVEEEGGRKREAPFLVPTPDRRPPTPHRTGFSKSKRRPSSKKETSGPLLPGHLLLARGELPRDIMFSKELGPDWHGPGAHNPYQERLWRALESQLTPLLPPNFLLPVVVLKHVVHLCRLLCGPERHGALVAFRRGTGRQALVDLAARATASLLMELPAEANEEQVLALLRLASWQAGVQGRRVLLLVHPGLSPAPLHLVMALMAEGTCPGLYGPEDTAPIVQTLLQEHQGIKRSMREDLVLQRFFQFVRNNLHVFLLLGAPGGGQGPSSLGLPPSTAAALSHLLCSLKVYQAWSTESLQEVAAKHLQGRLSQASGIAPVAGSLQTHQDLVPCIAKAAALIHSSASTYSRYLAACLPLVTPRSFLDLLDTSAWLLGRLQEQNSKRMDQMKLALHKMGEVSEKQQAHARNVRVLQDKLQKVKQQVMESQQEVERQQQVLKQQEKECQLYEARIDALTKERDELEKAKELAMRKMSKDYKAALAGLRAQDVEELRSYRQPPEQVVWVADILCKMFGEKPGWENAKQMLCQEDFYQELVFYPKDTIANDLFWELGEAVAENDVCAAASSIRSASRAAAALWQWICAVYWYHQALRNWQPSMERLELCDAQISSEKAHLGRSRLLSEQLRDTTRARIKELKETQQHQQRLLQQLTQSVQAREEATTVESSVAEHMASWTVVTQMLEQQQSTVHGDALLCAAALTYLGPFPPARREELLGKWQAVCAGARVCLGPDDVARLVQQELPCPGSASAGPPLLPVQQPFRLVSLLSSAREQRIWNRTRKPKDPESRLAGILLHSEARRRAHRWPLLVDPNKQATVWLLTTGAMDEAESQALLSEELVPDMVEQGDYDEMPTDDLEVLSLADPDLEQCLRSAASAGFPVLLVDFEKNIPWCPILEQLMQKETLQGAPTASSETMKGIPVSSSFQLYLCVNLPLEALAAELDPKVLKLLTVIDLRLSPAALEELLLGEVLRSERHEILRHRQALELGVLQLEAKLEATEEELVALISKPQRSLLEEENFMPMVQLLQTQIQALHATHQHMVSLYQDQAALCNKYRPVARLGVALRLSLQKLGRLHPLYLFPSHACISHMRHALLSTKRPDTDKHESLEARLLELSRAVLRHLLTEPLPGLREVDRLLYFFLGALDMLQVAGDSSPLEYLAFFQGFREPAAKELLRPLASVPRPCWVSQEAWEECRLLESLPGFQGLLASLARRPTQWQEYFRLPSTVVGLALCPSHTHLSPFQRAILWRILCPEAMSSVICDLTTCLLGWSPSEDVVITHAYSYSRTDQPIIFLVPPAGSPGSFTPPLHWIEQMAQQQGRVGKLAVISFGTPDAGGRVWRMLPFCAKKGKWLVLNNCHLQEQWDPEVLGQLDLVLNLQAGDAEGGAFEIHPKFRLWFITAADVPESVPGPVYRNGVVFFCEMPLELKSTLARSHRLLQGQVPGLDTNQGLALLVLYATLCYRQAYGQWIQAASYLWSHVELWEGFKAQERLSRLMVSPEAALQELAGSIPYGGHILDRGDAEAVQSLSQQCLASDVHLLPGPGLPSLLAAVRGSPSPELSEEEVVAATQARIEQLPSPMEPAWVGLCNSMQRELVASRSQAMLSALQAAQGLWQPRPPPSRCPKAALEELVGEGLELTQELVGQLEECGWEVGVRVHPPKGQPRPKPRPLQRFLLEEAGSLRALLQQVQRDLQCAQEHLQGPPCPSPRCAAILWELERGRVPRPWLQHTPTGPQPPQAWLKTLHCRCQLLTHYLQSQTGVPYQLAAFHHPQRLFLALRQETARAEKQELSRYSLEQQVLPTMLPPSNAPDKGGLYLTGLELRHARWDAHSSQLREALSAQLCKLPAVWVQATYQPWKMPSHVPTYQCPVFLGAPEAFVPFGSQRAVTHIALPCQLAPEACAQRRIHAVSVLHEGDLAL